MGPVSGQMGPVWARCGAGFRANGADVGPLWGRFQAKWSRCGPAVRPNATDVRPNEADVTRSGAGVRPNGAGVDLGAKILQQNRQSKDTFLQRCWRNII